MRLHNFFIEQKISLEAVGRELVVPDAALAHQLQHVFRLRQGDNVILLDNSGYRYVSRVLNLDKKQTTFHIEKQEGNVDATAAYTVVDGQRSIAGDINVYKPRLVLFQSLIKKDKFEWIVEKATELGAAAFVPVISERSEKKDINSDRLRKILKEASEQSGRYFLPELRGTVRPGDALFDDGTFYIGFDPDGEKISVPDIISRVKKENKTVGVLIGPEGGWSDGELEIFREKKIPVFSVGSQVLRSETAAIAMAAIFLLGH